MRQARDFRDSGDHARAHATVVSWFNSFLSTLTGPCKSDRSTPRTNRSSPIPHAAHRYHTLVHRERKRSEEFFQSGFLDFWRSRPDSCRLGVCDRALHNIFSCNKSCLTVAILIRAVLLPALVVSMIVGRSRSFCCYCREKGERSDEFFGRQ